MTAVRYVVAAVAAMAALLAAIVAANGILDPYGITQWAAIPGVNAVKPGLVGRERLYRAFEIRRVRPGAIALGTSRAAYGLTMESPAWHAEPRRNEAVGAATMHETARTFALAVEKGDVRRAVLGLDFFAFNARRMPYPDFSETLFDARVPDALLLASRYAAAPTLRDSFDMIQRQHEPLVALFTADGSFSMAEMTDRWRRIGGSRVFCRNTFRGFVTVEYAPVSGGFSLDQGPFDPLADLHTMIRAAKAHGVDLRLFFSPEHAWSLEAVRMAGLWSELERWKRRVVQLAADEGVVLWDFQRINARTIETVPPERDMTPMRWWWDASHYTQPYGRDILARVLADTAPEDEIGRHANPAMVDLSLDELRRGLDAYEANHPADMTELAAIAATCGSCRKR